LVSITSHKQIVVVVVAADYDYGNYDDYYDAAAAPSSDVSKGTDVSRLILPKTAGQDL
jgi:hypothetical protein